MTVAKSSTAAKLGEDAADLAKGRTPRRSKAAWKVLDRTSIVASGVLAPMVAAGAWRAVTGKRPPTLSRNPEIDTREAVAWAVVGGALVEVVKVVVRRGAAEYWVKSTGSLPPGMKSTVSSS